MQRLVDRRRFFFTTASGLLVAGCNGLSAPSQAPALTQATDGLSRIALPAGWKVLDDLHEKADIQAADRQQNAFLVVLTESKEDFAEGVTYRDHSQMTLDIIRKRAESFNISSGPTDLTINGRLAVRNVVTAVVGETRTRVTYLHTTVDGQKAFHQVLVWTSASRASKFRSVLETAIASFEDLS
jgi:hypothetical protein